MTTSKTKLLIVDDHPVFRLGLRQAIETSGDFQVVGEAGDGEQALAQIKSMKPGLVLVDVNLPKMGGLEVVRRVQDMSCVPACLVLTVDASESTFNAAMDAGAKGYMLKETALDDVLTALRILAMGGVYFCPLASAYLLKRRQRASALRQEKTGLTSLTPTELSVLQLISENKTNKEIGGVLFISPRTVEVHRRIICKKLELQGLHKLLWFAIKHRSEL